MERHSRGITAEQIRELIGDSPTMLEIGSHDGTDTARFLEQMPGARVFCFEPDQRALARFETMIDSPAVELCEMAVADIDGERQFWASTGRAGRMADWDYSGSLCKPTGHLTRSPEIGFKEPAPVPCIRLDTWLAHRPHLFDPGIDFIWADVQGSQRLVIAGGNRTLSITKWLYIESHEPPAYANEPTQDELIDELSETFEPIAFYAENILFKNRKAHD